jgi:DNA-binding transcriptional regulator LsrR (DeoR family)
MACRTRTWPSMYQRAADLYAQGWTLRQIGAELGVHWSTVSQQLQKAGV